MFDESRGETRKERTTMTRSAIELTARFAMTHGDNLRLSEARSQKSETRSKTGDRRASSDF
jgi:hypothetical protein